jgi:hypothetical protein
MDPARFEMRDRVVEIFGAGKADSDQLLLTNLDL